MGKYKIHQLVEMAIQGIEFRARREGYARDEWKLSEAFKNKEQQWLIKDMYSDWFIEYYPKFIWIDLDCRKNSFFIRLFLRIFGLINPECRQLEGKNWQIRAVQKIENGR